MLFATKEASCLQSVYWILEAERAKVFTVTHMQCAHGVYALKSSSTFNQESISMQCSAVQDGTQSAILLMRLREGRVHKLLTNPPRNVPHTELCIIV